MVDHSCLVHLNFRGGPTLRGVPHPAPDGVVGQTEVVLAAVDGDGAGAPVVRARVEGRPANNPSRTEGLGLVTIGVSF